MRGETGSEIKRKEGTYRENNTTRNGIEEKKNEAYKELCDRVEGGCGAWQRAKEHDGACVEGRADEEEDSIVNRTTSPRIHPPPLIVALQAAVRPPPPRTVAAPAPAAAVRTAAGDQAARSKLFTNYRGPVNVISVLLVLNQCLLFLLIASPSYFGMFGITRDGKGIGPVVFVVKAQFHVVEVLFVVRESPGVRFARRDQRFELHRGVRVSFFSTSPELSNKQRFEFFSRTIPSDHYQVKAMVEIVKLMQWNYVSILYEESNYGIKAFEELETLFAKYNVCIAVKEKLVKDSGVAQDSGYDGIVYKLLTKPRARGVIIFGSDQEVAGVMRAVRRVNATGAFYWIGSDGWSARSLVSDGNEREVEGTLSVQPRANPVRGFREYFLNLTVENNRRNPWFVDPLVGVFQKFYLNIATKFYVIIVLLIWFYFYNFLLFQYLKLDCNNLVDCKVFIVLVVLKYIFVFDSEYICGKLFSQND
ncbi:Uncharacterized protein GBIM_02124 [Gryllus bimaculatus]|nr:Uncharacterized protein GBIM_02124 [Gryllus bimaculatus]